jgi:hypothetical protein
MPESVTDRPTKAHEQVFLLTKEPRYFYDADAIREPPTDNPGGAAYYSSRGLATPQFPKHNPHRGDGGNGGYPAPAGRNRRSVWEIATEPYPDAHFATFPTALVEPCILAGTSERGCCPECGAPWKRETESERIVRRPDKPHAYNKASSELGGCRDLNFSSSGGGETRVTTLGWSPSCDHGLEPVPCTVLDCFSGSGTTALVARKHGRRSIGIELNSEYAALAAKRLHQLSLFA